MHFCRQYDEWTQALKSIDIYPEVSSSGGDKKLSDPTWTVTAIRDRYLHRIELVNEAAKIAGGEISLELLKAVTKGYSYADLEGQGVPFGRDYYYERYRRFFFELDKMRD